MTLNRTVKIMVFVSLASLAASFLLREIGADSDIWLHLKTGQYILENQKIPRQDIFSYTVSGKPWVNHEWLSQVISYAAFKTGGINGIILLRFFVIFSALCVLFKLIYDKRYYLIAALSLALFILASQNRFNDRPEMYTLLFAALYIYILQKFRFSKVLWLLPAAQLLWANMHGYYVLGPVIIFAYLIEGLIKRDLGYKRLIRVFIMSAVACAINPNGLNGILYPFKALVDINTTSKIFTFYIDELLPPFKIPSSAVMPYLVCYKILVVVSAVSLVLNFKKIRLSHLILFAMTLIMSVFAQRNIALFSLIACVALVPNINDLITPLGKRFNMDKYLLVISIVLIAVVAVMAYNAFTDKYYIFEKGGFKSRVFGVSEIRYPVKAAEFFKANKIKGPVLNNFYCGSYLIWALYPDERVFIDGRTELYGPDFYKYYRSALENNSALEALLEKWSVNCVLFFDPGKEPEEVVKRLFKSADWKLVYFDDVSSIFVRATPENSGIINKYAIDLPNFEIPAFHPDGKRVKGGVFPYRYLSWGKIFALVGLYDKAEESARIALAMDKHCMPAYNLLGITFIQSAKFEKAIETFKEALSIEPGNARLYYNLGIAYSALGDIDKATEAYLKASEIDPNFQSAKFGLTMCYKQKGKYDAAKKMLLSLAKNDLTGDANCQLGYIYLKEKDFAAAEKKFNRALRINQYNAMAYNGIGLVCGRQGRHAEAIAQFKKALQINPRFKEARDNLDVAYAKQNAAETDALLDE